MYHVLVVKLKKVHFAGQFTEIQWVFFFLFFQVNVMMSFVYPYSSEKMLQNSSIFFKAGSFCQPVWFSWKVSSIKQIDVRFTEWDFTLIADTASEDPVLEISLCKSIFHTFLKVKYIYQQLKNTQEKDICIYR